MKLADLLGQHGMLEIPNQIRNDCECVDCRGEFPKQGKLWTDESLNEPTGARAYSDWVNKIRMNTYCTFHAKKRAGLRY